MKSLNEAMGHLNETKELSKEEEILKDFKTYLEDNGYSEKDVDGQIINEYCTDLFYDLEDEEGLDNLNETEEVIRNHYNCFDSGMEYDDNDDFIF